MAKIRTVKPELFRHEYLFETEKLCNLPIRLAFIGLFTCCDREGRFRWRPRQLKLDIFPYDEMEMSDVLEALVQYGFILKYEVDGETYGCIPSWHKHQCINHRESDSDFPAPQEFPNQNLSKSNQIEKIDASLSHELIPLHIETTRETRVDHASRACPGTPGWKGNGSGKGRELEKEMEMYGDDASPPMHGQRDDAVKVFLYWKLVMDHPNAQLDDKRRMVIRKAMKAGYSISQLCQAIEGCSHTPYNMGTNDLGQRFDGLHVIFRDADQIDRFIRNCKQPPQQMNEAQKRSQSNLDVLQGWVERTIQQSPDTEVSDAEK